VPSFVLPGFALPGDTPLGSTPLDAARLSSVPSRSCARAAALLAAGVGALAAAAVAAAPGAAAADGGGGGGDALAVLRGCESGGDYTAATGNGYYGAYQFDLPTWAGLGLAGLPSDATPATQDATVVTLATRAGGWSPWPVCGQGLGAVPSAGAGIVTAAIAAPGPLAATQPAPPVPVQVLTLAPDAAPSDQVLAWQQRMADRGWQLTVDGVFGPATQRVARDFAVEKGIVEGLPGEVGPLLWSAAWTATLA
jgi:hypothetical protein